MNDVVRINTMNLTMSKDNIGHRPVFPICDMNSHPGPIGLTIRDYFAAKAMQGFCANNAAMPQTQEHFDNIAEDACRMADAMLKALCK